MKITFLTVGKNSDREIENLINRYVSRLSHYVKFEIRSVADVKFGKTMTTSLQKEMEGKQILSVISSVAYVVLLDEKGKEYTSREFADKLNGYQLRGLREIVFVVGGPFGFSQDMYNRADELLSFSRMTLTHNMIRLFFVEQVYRAFTIIRGESYHHD